MDTGDYQCCGQIKGESLCHTAKVVVRFQSSADESYDHDDDSSDPVPTDGYDLCHAYPAENTKGMCSEYLSGLTVHADSTEKINEIEIKIADILKQFHKDVKLSKECAQFAPRAFCHYLLPTCEREDGTTTSAHVRLCRSDCEMVKYSKCSAEFAEIEAGEDGDMKMYAAEFKCKELPDTQQKCTSIGLPPVLDKQHNCFKGQGIGKHT